MGGRVATGNTLLINRNETEESSKNPINNDITRTRNNVHVTHNEL